MNTTDNTQQAPSGKDANKIYFLIVVILALLGTNAYLFFKDKKANDRIVTITDEKSSMATEIDKIESELDKANLTLEQSYSTNAELNEKMKEQQEQARVKIAELRQALKKGQLTQGQLKKAQEDIKQLRYFVTKYTADIETLRSENKTLLVERDSLRNTVASATARAEETEKINEELATKVKAAAALKSDNVSVTPLRLKNSGRETDVNRASSAEKIRINFSVNNNPVAQKGLHDVFVRVIDPNGNLIVSPNNGQFIADGDEMQYSYRTAIEFSNDDKSYSIDWTNPEKFEKGTYTVILYADGFTMGRSTVSLR